MEALKRPEAEAEAEDRSVRAVVEQMLANIRNRGEDSVREIAERPKSPSKPNRHHHDQDVCRPPFHHNGHL